jgi:cytochrome c peroxidase
MQNIIDFPPAPKLDPTGRLDSTKASAQELAGEQIFFGKGKCAQCHVPQTAFMDMQMHDLKLERFYEPGQTVNGLVMLPDGPIKTTLADTVEFFNLVLGTLQSAASEHELCMNSTRARTPGNCLGSSDVRP